MCFIKYLVPFNSFTTVGNLRQHQPFFPSRSPRRSVHTKTLPHDMHDTPHPLFLWHIILDLVLAAIGRRMRNAALGSGALLLMSGRRRTGSIERLVVVPCLLYVLVWHLLSYWLIIYFILYFFTTCFLSPFSVSLFHLSMGSWPFPSWTLIDCGNTLWVWPGGCGNKILV